jgi:hypothetical protein
MESNSSKLATSPLSAASAPEEFSRMVGIRCVPPGIDVPWCLRASKVVRAAQPTMQRFQVWASSRPSAK